MFGSDSQTSLNFGPFLATTSAYTGISLISRRITSLKRSASRDWSIRLRSSRFVGPAGFATISRRSEPTRAALNLEVPDAVGYLIMWNTRRLSAELLGLMPAIDPA